jgi:hypothetical protein
MNRWQFRYAISNHTHTLQDHFALYMMFTYLIYKFTKSVGSWVTGCSACVFYGRTGPAYNWPPASIFYGGTGPDGLAGPCGLCPYVTTGRREKWRENWTREKNDDGRREKWWEKDKTTVGWRAFEVLKPRSWEWNPVPVYRGPETQVLRVTPNVRLSRSSNPGPQSQIPRSWNPISWEPNAATQACRHMRIVSNRHGYPLVKVKDTETWHN